MRFVFRNTLHYFSVKYREYRLFHNLTLTDFPLSWRQIFFWLRNLIFENTLDELKYSLRCVLSFSSTAREFLQLSSLCLGL